MTDDPPHWFGEPTEDETPPVDPPTVSADWFSDIESDTLPNRSTASQATEAPESARPDREATAETGTADPEPETASATATGTADPEPATTTEAPESAGGAASATPSGTTEMDGTRETTAEEMAADDDGDDSGGFVAWLKGLFGLS